MVFGLFMT